jgi:hypothetical protein
MNYLLFVARRELKGLFCNFKSTLGQEGKRGHHRGSTALGRSRLDAALL